MDATEVYQLKLKIDEALRSYQASAIGWQTHWCNLRIVKYDHLYSADRSVIFQAYIKDEADWQKREQEIKAELAAVCAEQE